jgi:hypothetical protein
MLTALELATAADQAVEATHVDLRESERQAQLAQVALRTGKLQPGGDERDYILLDVCLHAV